MKFTKAELEYLVNAKAHTKRHPGYFKEGKFQHIPYYTAHLGTKCVGFADGFKSYRPEIGGYLFHAEALAGAKAFREKMREWLEAGNYEEAGS